jgi:hypothetical protein
MNRIKIRLPAISWNNSPIREYAISRVIMTVIEISIMILIFFSNISLL